MSAAQNSTQTSVPPLDEFIETARTWLEAHTEYRAGGSDDKDLVWGEGEFSVSVFHSLTFEEESALLEKAKAWTQAKAEHGYHAITQPIEYGGLGYPREYARAYSKLESLFVTPTGHETHSVTVGLIAPTINVYGTPEQKEQFVGRFMATRELACQLFSEPGAGSDLAGLACRADRDGDEWVLNGQKVWSSGAQFSEWGELIARSDVDAVKHKGMTAFIIPMDLPGIEIRPIKQMSGGSSFNEVFFNDVRVPDSVHGVKSLRLLAPWESRAIPSCAKNLPRRTPISVLKDSSIAEHLICVALANLLAQKDHSASSCGPKA
jgi:alkylation response protein AidB-like acyl-CoA dehydrogenase